MSRALSPTELRRLNDRPQWPVVEVRRTPSVQLSLHSGASPASLSARFNERETGQGHSPTPRLGERWSPVPDSNRRPLPYHGSALPTELTGRRAKLDVGEITSVLLRSTTVTLRRARHTNCQGRWVSACREKDSNLRRRLPADLQSASFGRSDIPAHTETVRRRTVSGGNVSQTPIKCPMSQPDAARAGRGTPTPLLRV